MAALGFSTLPPAAHNMGLKEPMGSIDQELPAALTGPLVWTGVTFAEGENYVLQLGKNDVEEIGSALQKFKELDLNEDHISRQTFPLPQLEARLRDASLELHKGRGFFVVKGLEQVPYDVEDSVKVFLGIASYIANQRGRQDKQGNVLSHITSSKSWTVPMSERHGIHSDSALPFHNDMGCDILALQARHVAEKGGLTYLASAWTVFDKLLLREPEVIRTLLEPNWPVQISGREGCYYLAPALTIHEGNLMSSMDPNRFGPHPSYTGSQKPPSLTSDQLYALERVSAVAREVELGLRLEKGDLLFFNNWALLHRRDSYQDGEDTSRHLVRLWLRDSHIGWPVPESMLPPWVAAYGSEQTVANAYSMHPYKEYKKPKYTAGSAAFIIEDVEEAVEGVGQV